MRNFSKNPAQIAPCVAKTALIALVLGLFATPALAAAPGTLLVQGAIRNSSGGAAPDGKYIGKFSLYATENGGSAVWTEGVLPMEVSGGRFTVTLGQTKPLTPAVLGSLKEAWLGVAIDLNAEQKRVRLHAVPYAVAAKSAEGLSCTACVSLAALKFDSDVNLAGNALSAGKITAATIVGQSINAQTVTAQSFVGDGSKLTGIQSISGSCSKPGEVVRGIKSDGTLICVPGGGASGLPKDGLDEISNGVLSNEFIDSGKAGPIKIPDNNPLGVASTIDMPDFGNAKSLSVYLDVQSSGLSQLEVTLFDPNNVKYVLLAKGAGQGTALKTSFPTKTQPASGDLSVWNGKNPKGKWRLLVVDYLFKDNTFDGQVNEWRVDMHTVSNKKVQVNGDLVVHGNVTGSKGFNIVGDTTFSGKVVFKDEVVFEKAVKFLGGMSFGNVQKQFFELCEGEAGLGPCRAELSYKRNFLEAAKYCAAQKGDICTDSQSTRVRALAAGQSIYNFSVLPNWTNSFADNDGGQWNVANGGTGDNHSHTSLYLTPCCHNITPKTPGEQDIGGVRVLKINNADNANWDTAVKACLALKADLCDKSQYRVLRNNGKFSARAWASDHSDNDNTGYDKAVGSVSDNPSPGQNYGYACCATKRYELKCPAGAQDINGVCVAKIHNGGTNFSNASTACAALGARLCSIAQTAVLRSAGKISSSASWTGSYSDNDGNQASIGVGNAGDDHHPNSGYGYACCF